MSQLFRSYDTEFDEVLKNADRDIEALRARVSPQVSKDQQLSSSAAHAGPPLTVFSTAAERATLLRQIQSQLGKLKEIATSMEFESNDIQNVSDRAAARARVADCKRFIFKTEKEHVRMKGEVVRVDREELLPRGQGDAAGAEHPGPSLAEVESQKNRMSEATTRMQKSTMKLQKAEQIVNESDALADNSLEHLAKQRETMHHIQGETREVNSEVDQSRRTLSQMKKVMINNKAMLILIIAVLLLMIFILLYIKFGGTSTTATVPPAAASNPAGPPPRRLHNAQWLR